VDLFKNVAGTGRCRPHIYASLTPLTAQTVIKENPENRNVKNQLARISVLLLNAHPKRPLGLLRFILLEFLTHNIAFSRIQR
jgi:hypothetical protein